MTAANLQPQTTTKRARDLLETACGFIEGIVVYLLMRPICDPNDGQEIPVVADTAGSHALDSNSLQRSPTQRARAPPERSL